MRSWAKRIVRHLPYLIAGGAAGGVVMALIGTDQPWQALSLATAYASFFYVSAALAVGPQKVLAGGQAALSTPLRRDFGIWAGIFAVAHVVAGLNVHFGGRFWRYFVFPADAGAPFPIRFDAFGTANYLGAIGTVIIVVLLALSNNTSVRKFGPHRWKRTQQLAYPLFVIVTAHGLIYQSLEKRNLFAVLFFTAIFCGVGTLQALGFMKRRKIPG
jgi:sulfoxide reductase heme-binding subunit YedZ